MECHGGLYWHEVLVGWNRPEGDWVKINVNEASKGNTGLVGVGGVIRDSSGMWAVGFALNISNVTSAPAEAWALFKSLQISWKRDFKKVVVEIDSMIVLQLLNMDIGDEHLCFSLIYQCKQVLVRDYVVRLQHVYKGGNGIVDWLSNYAFHLDLGFHIF